ncbi:tlde1 domain-containing protein [Burkholderia glumae]|uniref:DUF2778 domain-containing protein n=1 Tax=Burkholderia glumae TaxID=337 RepID=A0AAP9Y2L7_BURGL|nr:DUF2778 domain-containing protein [Burkholderia glumae]NVE23844.1 DUF2778 domain-containing protein [Burkholderia glumae]QJP72454.1 DUF2778 domain-containing protein [Burkholderia glumae]QJW79742.1 DUF2778 domain-containing protein [Burkholderia glumae]QPQ92669.1 DUF2778 domain-containing protein [Burkholderia glumae]
MRNAKSVDSTFAEKGQPENFRLHPMGRMRLSEGCVTVTDQKRCDQLEKRGGRANSDSRISGAAGA